MIKQLRNNFAYILIAPNVQGYSLIFDELQKAQNKNKQLNNKLHILKVKLSSVGYEKNI